MSRAGPRPFPILLLCTFEVLQTLRRIRILNRRWGITFELAELGRP